jgi:lipopolysaccharide export system permease protein
VSVEQASDDGEHLRGVTIYRRDARGSFIGRVSASQLDWNDGRWTLTQMSSMTLQNGGVQRLHQATVEWRSNLRPADLKRLDTPSLPLSSATLGDVLEGARVGDRPLSYYRTALYHGYAAPFVLMLMLLLALPSTRAVQRGGEGSGALLIALAAGLGGAGRPRAAAGCGDAAAAGVRRARPAVVASLRSQLSCAEMWTGIQGKR